MAWGRQVKNLLPVQPRSLSASSLPIQRFWWCDRRGGKKSRDQKGTECFLLGGKYSNLNSRLHRRGNVCLKLTSQE
jgi:hypothetical protein